MAWVNCWLFQVWVLAVETLLAIFIADENGDADQDPDDEIAVLLVHGSINKSKNDLPLSTWGGFGKGQSIRLVSNGQEL